MDITDADLPKRAISHKSRQTPNTARTVRSSTYTLLSSTNRTQGKILRNRSAILTVLSPIKYIFSGTKLEMIFHNTEVGFRVKTKTRLSFHLVAVHSATASFMCLNYYIIVFLKMFNGKEKRDE